MEPSEASSVPPESDESDGGMERIQTTPAAPAAGQAPGSSSSASSALAVAAPTTSGDSPAGMRLLLPCVAERIQETEGVLEVLLRMMQGSPQMELVFVHVVPTGQSEQFRQQGRLLLRLLNARGIQVVWREADRPHDFSVIRTEARVQRATHVVLPLEGLPQAWEEDMQSLSMPVLLVRPEVKKEKEPDDPEAPVL